MSFLNKSIEDSLKLINSSDASSSQTQAPPKRKRGRPRKKIANTSPVRVPQMSPVDKFSPFRTTSRPSSPIALQRSPQAEEKIVPPITPKPEENDNDADDETLELKETKNITSILESK